MLNTGQVLQRGWRHFCRGGTGYVKGIFTGRLFQFTTSPGVFALTSVLVKFFWLWKHIVGGSGNKLFRMGSDVIRFQCSIRAGLGFDR